jgi:ABC-2 type transport system ATP-binding protein
MIEVSNVTKTYGDVVAVDEMDFVVKPGIVTGFLGPNGAGKSTTMRVILGLDRPTSGHARVNGHSYADSRAPITELGALLEARALDKGRSARNHLLALGATVGIGARRVDEMLEVVGLTEVARKPAGGFSLGMGQRLGIAVALLADPEIVMLDEPVNGLDPDGIQWIRTLLKGLAADGRTVFVSSHLMSEMELTAEHLIVVGRGRVIADEPMDAFIARAGKNQVLVASPQADALGRLLAGPDVTVTSDAPNRLAVQGLSAAAIGDVAAAHDVTLHELMPITPSLEEAYMELTKDDVTYHGTAATPRSLATNERAA